MQHPGETSTPFQGCVLYGTVNGSIGEAPSQCAKHQTAKLVCFAYKPYLFIYLLVTKAMRAENEFELEPFRGWHYLVY